MFKLTSMLNLSALCYLFYQDMVYGSYDLAHGSIDQMMRHVSSLPQFQEAITVQHVNDDITAYKLHR